MQASFYLTLAPIIHKTPIILKFLKVLGKFVLLGMSKMPLSHYICTVSEAGINTELNLVYGKLSMKSLIQNALTLFTLCHQITYLPCPE